MYIDATYWYFASANAFVSGDGRYLSLILNSLINLLASLLHPVIKTICFVHVSMFKKHKIKKILCYGTPMTYNIAFTMGVNGCEIRAIKDTLSACSGIAQ